MAQYFPFIWKTQEKGKPFYLQSTMRNAIEEWWLAVSITKGWSAVANTPKAIRVSAQHGQEEAAHFNKGRTSLQRSDNGDAIDKRDTGGATKIPPFVSRKITRPRIHSQGERDNSMLEGSSHYQIQLCFVLIKVAVDTQIPHSLSPTLFPFLQYYLFVRYFAFLKNLPVHIRSIYFPPLPHIR